MKVQDAKIGDLSKSKKKKKKRSFLWLKILAAMALLAGTVVLCALSPFFNIESIRVNGCEHYGKEEIIQSSNVLTGENGFKILSKNIGSIYNLDRFLFLRCALAEDSIIKNRAYIKESRVKYLLPGTIDITITERQPIGFVPYMGTNLVIDDEAFVVDTSGKNGAQELPFIKGLDFGSYEIGQALNLENPLTFDTVKKILGILKESRENGNDEFAIPVDYIDASNLSNTCLFVDSRITVNFGDVYNLTYEELLYRVNFFKEIFTKKLKEQDKGLVDFTMGENPKFIPQ